MTRTNGNNQKRSLIGTHKRDPSKYKLDKPKKGTCGYYLGKTGGYCESTVLYSNGKCKLHGGIEGKSRPVSPSAGASGPLQNGVRAKTNIYEIGLLESEKGKVFEDIVKEIGTLDSELHMARLFLRRGYAAQKNMEEAREAIARNKDNPDKWILIANKHGYMRLDRYEILPNGRLNTTPEIRRELQDKAYERIHRRKNSFAREIRQYSNIVKNLEKQRKELLDNRGDSSEEFIRELAGSLRAFTDTVTNKIHNGASFCTGNYPNLKPRKHDSE